MPTFMEKLRNAGSQASSWVGDEMSKIKNRDVMDATVAACVLVAAADGKIDSSEKQKVLGLLKNSQLTKAFSTDAVIKTFKEHSDRFDFDVDVGRSEALRVIGKHRSVPENARAIVRATIIIANADGNFDQSEKAAVSQIARELGLDPSEFI